MRTIVKGLIQVDYTNKDILVGNGVPDLLAPGAPLPEDPHVYLELGTGALYTWDGTAWDLASSEGSVSVFTDNGNGTLTHSNGSEENPVNTLLDFRASAIPILDAGNVYVSTDVEGALQEIPNLIAGGVLDGLIDLNLDNPPARQLAFGSSTGGEFEYTSNLTANANVFAVGSLTGNGVDDVDPTLQGVQVVSTSIAPDNGDAVVPSSFYFYSKPYQGIPTAHSPYILTEDGVELNLRDGAFQEAYFEQETSIDTADVLYIEGAVQFDLNFSFNNVVLGVLWEVAEEPANGSPTVWVQPGGGTIGDVNNWILNTALGLSGSTKTGGIGFFIRPIITYSANVNDLNKKAVVITYYRYIN